VISAYAMIIVKSSVQQCDNVGFLSAWVYFWMWPTSCCCDRKKLTSLLRLVLAVHS